MKMYSRCERLSVLVKAEKKTEREMKRDAASRKGAR